MNLSTVYQKQEDIIVRQVAGETLLIPLCGQLADMQNIFTLNTVAEFIWMQLDGKQNLKIIQEKVTDHFQSTEDQVISDIVEYIEQLAEAKLVVEVK
jgi:hypothetical protein